MLSEEARIGKRVRVREVARPWPILPASVSETACCASSKEYPLLWARAFVWRIRTSSAISETL